MSRILLCSQTSIGVHDCLELEDRTRATPECDPLCGKNRQPERYQRQCPGCGRWSIWEPCPPELDDRGGAS